MSRNKKQISYDQDLLKKAEHICDTFALFTTGIRVMFLIHRSKEGAVSANQDKLRKLISRNPTEFQENLYQLLVQKEASEDTLRIYSSVNSRNTDKAERRFKEIQLDNDYADEESCEDFYLDIRNRYISCLMSPNSSNGSLFILDLDSVAEYETALIIIAQAGLNDKIVQKYPTKNGWHIVMQPFNPALLGTYSSKIHRDALILLDY